MEMRLVRSILQPDNSLPFRPRICKNGNCKNGGEYVPTHERQEYCNEKCRQAARRARAAAKLGYWDREAKKRRRAEERFYNSMLSPKRDQHAWDKMLGYAK